MEVGGVGRVGMPATIITIPKPLLAFDLIDFVEQSNRGRVVHGVDIRNVFAVCRDQGLEQVNVNAIQGILHTRREQDFINEMFQLSGNGSIGFTAGKLRDALAQTSHAFGLIPDVAMDGAFILPAGYVAAPTSDQAVDRSFDILPITEEGYGVRLLFAFLID